MDGVRIRPHLDSNGRDLAIEHVQDVEPILLWNSQSRREEQHGDWGRHIARIPNVIYVRWLNEEHARGNLSLRMFTPEFDLIVQNKLGDPEWAYLRTDRPKLQSRLVSGANVTQIVDYASLQTAVIEYLARNQDATLIARIPTFIQLAEAKFNRLLLVRQMEQRATALVNFASSEPEFISLPGDFQSMRRVRLSSVTGKPGLEFKSGTQIDEYRFGISDIAGRPRYFTVFGDEIEVAPTPDAAYTIEMVYRRNIPPLAANDPNWLLTLAPDLYLYGALLESAPYIKEDGRIQTWGLGFTSALNDLNNLGQTSTFNAGPMTVRVSGQVF